MLSLVEAHQQTRGAGVTVAVVDSGVQHHRDLRGALLPTVDAAPPGTRDDTARGTQLAGLVAARGDGRAGALGVAPEAKVLPVKVGGAGYDAPPAAVAAGIERAVVGGATVIVSTYSGSEVPDALAAAVRRAVAADAVVIAPAGPALSLADLPGVVSVAAVDRDDRPLRDAVRGLRLDVAAPGTDLVAPVRTSLGDDVYVEVDGAEYAAALVGGVAALVRSRHPKLSQADVVRRLARREQRDLALGRGVVNAADALAGPPAELPAVGRDPAPGSGTGALPRDRQWYLDALGLPDAHRVSRGDGVTLGLVAARIDTTGPGLADRVSRQVWIDEGAEVGHPPAGPARPEDTAVAALAGGAGGNGLLGAAPAAGLIAAGGDPDMSAARVTAAVRWLVDHGAGVVLVVNGADALEPAAAGYALERDAVVVAPYSARTAAVPGVVTVRAADRPDAPAAGEEPALAAPGQTIVVYDDGPVGTVPAEAAAAALVAGTVALVRARHTDADTAAVVAHLLATATTVADGSPAAYGHGIVDPVAALTTDVRPVDRNPLGVPVGAARVDGTVSRAWVVAGITTGVAVVLIAGLLAVLLNRRRRAR